MVPAMLTLRVLRAKGGLGRAADGSQLLYPGQPGTRLETAREALVRSGYWAGAAAL